MFNHQVIQSDLFNPINLSPNVGGHVYSHWKGHVFTHHPKKGHENAELPLAKFHFRLDPEQTQQRNGLSRIEWDLTNGPLSKLLELLDTQV